MKPTTWEYGWLKFTDLGRIDGGVTRRYEVASKSDGSVLGWVVWKTEWRKYVLKTVAMNVWLDDSCLTAIAAFAKMQTDERKLSWKGAQT